MMQTEEAKLKSALMAAERECALLGAVVEAAQRLHPTGFARCLDTAKISISDRLAIRDITAALKRLEESKRIAEFNEASA